MHYRQMYKCCLALLILCTLNVIAADLFVNGSIGSELFSSPETGFIAGMRYQMYTTVKSQTRPINVRVIALYQNEEELRQFKQPNWLTFTPTIDWASVSVRGNLYKSGPVCVLNLGNLVAEYSPYLLWLSDDLEHDFRTPKPRGVSLEKIKVGNFEVDGLSVWETLESNDSLNTIGVRVNYNRSCDAKNEFIYLNTGVRSHIQEKPHTAYSIDISRNIGIFNLGGIYASETKTETTNLIDSYISTDIDSYSLSFFYRNYSDTFNPVYRLARPEFDPQSGKYIGWNPVDKYSGLVGTQIAFFDRKTQGKNLYSSYERYHNNKDSSDLNTISFKINLPIKSSNLHFRTKLISVQKKIGLGIPDYMEKTITEILYEKPILDGLKLFINKKDIMEQYDKETYGAWGLKGNTRKGISWEAGQRILPNNKQWFNKIKYTSPSGINIQWNQATPEIEQTSKYNYDDEYKLIEWDNFVKVWVKVDL